MRKRYCNGLANQVIDQILSHYQIIKKLGEGGMGEVYLAEDSKLGRTVALKILPAELAQNRERMHRFLQEARAAASLNHPNVAHIYEISEANGIHFIAMEHVEGLTLAASLSGTPLDTKKITDIGLAAADALAEAHAKGITHRDIKPSNIMITSRGVVKVLDFGLAKFSAANPTSASSDVATAIKTSTGAVVGTVHYMSPEQGLGREVDHRTDIFSLGIVLYEMVTGRRPFEGQTATETIDAIAHFQPEAMSRFNYNLPAELELIIRKCLEKDRTLRYQSAHELVIDLKNLQRYSSSDRIVSKSAGEVATASASDLSRRKGLLLALLLVTIVAAGFLVYWLNRPRSRVKIDSVAVLPFINASNDVEAEYLSDGITESLINNLSQLPGLRVMSRNSVFRFKGRETDAQAAGNALGVEAVLTGRVAQRGDALLISIELVDARENTHIWGEQYNRKLTDILTVQQEIAREVSEKLRLKLTGEEQRLVTKRYTQSPEAYELYLKGQYFSGRTTEEGFRKAIELYQQAIAKDPNYALAYAAMATAYSNLGGVLGYVSPREAAPQAKEAVTRALQLDETLDEAHYVLGNLKLYYEWDWPGAEREFKRAIQLNPNHAAAHSSYGTYLQSLGKFGDAVNERERSRELNPVSPMATANVGYPMYFARRYDEAPVYYQRALDLDPNFSWGHLWIGQVRVQQGKYDEAISDIKKAISLSPDNTRAIATLGHAYAVAGKLAEALQVLEDLQGLAKQKYVSPYFVALIYTGLGDRDQAFVWLEKAYEERHPYLTLINVEPVFDSIRSDPRFANLLRRIGLPN